MNAGCYGGETWRYVARVEVLTRGGHFDVRPPSAYAIGYRSVRRADGGAPDGIFTAAWFAFPPGDGRAARERIAELLRRRIATQPLDLPNAGQRLPQSAGRPRRAADRELRPQGLRGRRGARVGEAREFHRQPATARAKAADIEAIIAHVRDDGAREDGRRTASPKCKSSVSAHERRRAAPSANAPPECGARR